MYGDADKLEKRLEEYKKNKEPDSKLGVKEITSYIKGDGPKIVDKKLYGDMTLGELRGHFQSDQMIFKELQGKELRKNEADLVIEIEQLKKEKQEQRLQRQAREQDMAELLHLVRLRKELEVKSTMESGKIISELEKAKKSKTGKEKVIELQRLSEEREGIRLKETELFNEISKYQKNVDEQEAKFNQEKEANKIKGESGKNYLLKGDLLRREKEFTKAQPAKIAMLKYVLSI